MHHIGYRRIARLTMNCTVWVFVIAIGTNDHAIFPFVAAISLSAFFEDNFLKFDRSNSIALLSQSESSQHNKPNLRSSSISGNRLTFLLFEVCCHMFEVCCHMFEVCCHIIATDHVIDHCDDEDEGLRLPENQLCCSSCSLPPHPSGGFYTTTQNYS
jgi:hypothetical protein